MKADSSVVNMPAFTIIHYKKDVEPQDIQMI